MGPLRAGVCAALAMATGCNLVFGLEPPAGDDVGGDGDVGEDGMATDAPCATTTVDAALLADAFMVRNSTQNFGTQSLVNAGVTLDSIALWQFSTEQLPAGATLDQVRMHLTFAGKSSACAASCGGCASYDQAGPLTVHYARSDWAEGLVTWNERFPAAAWGAAGASMIGVDRTAPIAAVQHGDDQDTDIVLSGAALDEWALWNVNSRVSFLISPGAGAVAVVAAREYASLEPGCTPPPAAATLAVTYCTGTSN